MDSIKTQQSGAAGFGLSIFLSSHLPSPISHIPHSTRSIQAACCSLPSLPSPVSEWGPAEKSLAVKRGPAAALIFYLWARWRPLIWGVLVAHSHAALDTFLICQLSCLEPLTAACCLRSYGQRSTVYEALERSQVLLPRRTGRVVTTKG